MPCEPPKTPPFWRSASALMWLAAVVVGGFYLVTEHQAHLFGALPFLVLLAWRRYAVATPRFVPSVSKARGLR